MIYSVFTDRLGNNLFQFAAALSLDDNVTICVPDNDEFLETIKYKDIFFKDFSVINHIPKDIDVYIEPSYEYSKIPYINGRDLILKGYFQSYKYIDREKILKYFKINDSILSSINILYPDLLSSNFSVIHVRRGDYLKVLYKHPFCGLSYYNDAIKKIGYNKKFIVVSDDISWCKKNIKAPNIKYIEKTSPIIDFFIMTLGNNLIISNSSFSYWGAFLNKKKQKVIAPSMWFGFKHNVDTSDLLSPEYYIINNNYSVKLFVKALLQFIKHYINYNILK